MSRFYRDLHDRELLSQATAVFSELMSRHLIDVFLPEENSPSGNFFPRRPASAGIENGRLALRLEREFFSQDASAPKA